MTSYIHTINPQIANLIGESEAILLNQLDYWISKCGRDIDNLDGKWIYNSYKKWSEQFTYWSTSKLRRTIKSLENLGLIKSTKVNSKKWNQTKWYTIDYEKYAKLFKNSKIKSSFLKNTPKIKEDSILNPDIRHDLKLIDDSFSIQSHSNKPKLNTNKLDNNVLSNIKKKLKVDQEVEFKSEITSKSPEVCICSKWTNRCVQNEQMLIVTKNNYTKNNSSKKKNILAKKEEEINFSEEKEELSKQMVNLWNEVFEYSLNPIKAYTNQNNGNLLLDILDKYFNNDLSQWREYALKVNSSQFLMGEKETKSNFKATFSWLIKYEAIEKITNNEYGVGDRELDMNNQKDNIKKKTEELVNKVDKKISSNIKEIITTTKNEEEFEKYIVNKGYKEDNDQYGIEIIADRIPKYNLFNNKEYEIIKEHLYEKYIFKKILNVEKPQIKERIQNKLEEKIKSNNSSMVLEELTQQEKKIDSMNFLHNIQNRDYADIMIEITQI